MTMQEIMRMNANRHSSIPFNTVLGVHMRLKITQSLIRRFSDGKLSNKEWDAAISFMRLLADGRAQEWK